MKHLSAFFYLLGWLTLAGLSFPPAAPAARLVVE